MSTSQESRLARIRQRAATFIQQSGIPDRISTSPWPPRVTWTIPVRQHLSKIFDDDQAFEFFVSKKDVLRLVESGNVTERDVDFVLREMRTIRDAPELKLDVIQDCLMGDYHANRGVVVKSLHAAIIEEKQASASAARTVKTRSRSVIPSNWLKNQMLARKLTKYQFDEINHKTIQRILDGKPIYPITVEKIAAVLRVDPADIPTN